MKTINIELSLSRKIDKITQRKEIVIHYKDSDGINVKVPSNLYLDEKYFQHLKKLTATEGFDGKDTTMNEVCWNDFDHDQADRLLKCINAAKTDAFYHILPYERRKKEARKWLMSIFQPRIDETFSFRAMYPIKKEFVRRIFDGSKGYEFRKSFCDPRINTIVIYESDGRGMVVGEFHIKDRLCYKPDVLWDLTKEYAGISEEDFFDYFKGCDKACAYVIGDISIFLKPKKLEAYNVFKAPQNYVYLDKINYNGTE